MNLTDLDQKQLFIYMNERKSPGVCAIVELLGCIFGFSGIGVMFAGSPGLGIVMMVCYWMWLVTWACVGAATLGLGLIMLPLWWLIAAMSASQTAEQYNRVLLVRLMR